MFQRDGKRYCAINKEGFRVERSGSPLTQFILHYIEADHVLDYPLENLTSGSVTLINIDSITKWNNPYQNDAISSNKSKQIAERIVSALQFLGDKALITNSGDEY